ncbi:hypothetical protein A7U60_g2465 [Sanghuangporus baumii]|uniref:Uncharacterized protein n=1 Tax=Sanghuangporus baumii TaxID=108892 RepID=A0A9Q5I2D8_SANBA|nr:hypothetical protein A7U60_g2465 [Sanghuangporus baumii]
MNTVDYSRYRWREDDNVPGRVKREIGGGELFEDVLNFNKYGEQNLFLGVYFQVSQLIDTSHFIETARKAWISLRWDVPTVAAQMLHEPREGSPAPAALLVYAPPADRAEAEAWAGQTVILKEGFEDLDTLRYEVVKGVMPEKDLVPQSFLYAVPFSPSSFGLLLYTSHIPFDGAGVKVLMTRYLEHLSKYIVDPGYVDAEKNRHKWGSETQNLLPIASEILRRHEPAEFDANGTLIKPELPEEPREGPNFWETLNQVMTDLARGAPLAHPFKSLKSPLYDQSKDTPATRRAAYTFTVEESKAIVEACRNAPDKLTVNQLAHGCLSLLTVLDNPPEPGSSNVVIYYGLVDSRQRLAREYRGALDYPGYCLGMSPIQVPVNIIDKYAGDINKNLKSVVLEFAQVVKREYLRQQAFPALLGIENQQVEMMLSVPPPPPSCGPWFGGDGRGAIYLKPRYPQNADTVLEITDFFVGLGKTDPGPFFRITEWNGRIMLGADYNQKAVESSVVDGWMKKWAELILAAS